MLIFCLLSRELYLFTYLFGFSVLMMNTHESRSRKTGIIACHKVSHKSCLCSLIREYPFCFFVCKGSFTWWKSSLGGKYQPRLACEGDLEQHFTHMLSPLFQECCSNIYAARIPKTLHFTKTNVYNCKPIDTDCEEVWTTA